MAPAIRFFSKRKRKKTVFLALAIAVTVLGILPLLLRGRFTATTIVGALAFAISLPATYFDLPSLVWPFWGFYGTMVIVLWIVCAIVDGPIVNRDSYNFHTSPLYWFVSIVLLVCVGSCSAREFEMFHATEYSALLGTVEQKVWTQDVQPKDPRHIRMSSAENATQLARQTLGQVGSIGSQFQLDESKITLQKVNDKFWWIAPLDFNGWSSWRNTRSVPYYVRVNAEDPSATGELITLPESESMFYTPGAYWSHNLDRHLWTNGYNDKALTDYSLEVDEAGKTWWVITVYHPTLFTSGEKVDGVVIVDPTTGNHQFHSMKQLPDWVDRVIPQGFVNNYITWRGMLHLGWKNAHWPGQARKDLTKPETPNLIYGSDGDLYWATGITSANDNDTSLVGLYYTNSRTGKSVFYQAKGSTDQAILAAVNKDGDVQFRHLHGADAQLYNVYGHMTSIVPLLNDNHLFQGVAFVNVENIQVLGVGSDQYEALRNYQKALPLSGQQVAPELAHQTQTVTGTVDRLARVVQNGEEVVYLHVTGIPHLFTGSAKLSVKLPLTHPGDTVTVSFFASGEEVEPMNSFDNQSLVLKATKSGDNSN